jgi:hypothetical protein
MLDDALPQNLKAFAQREFVGERMVWAEKPDVSASFYRSFGIWLFAIPWTAFALLWETMVAGPVVLDALGYDVGGVKPRGTMVQTVLWVMALFGIPFIAVGFYMLASPFIALWRGKRTLYVLTNRRLAILQGEKTIELQSILPRDIVTMTRKERSDGRGSLSLSLGQTRDSDGDLVEKTIELGIINEVRHVEKLILDLKDKQKD